MPEQTLLTRVGDVNARLIPGFPGYLAAEDGSLWSCWKSRGGGIAGPSRQVMGSRWHKLKPSPRKEDGRGRLTLKREDGAYERRYASHFILLAYVGPRPGEAEACHEDGDCLNDRPGNLRWDTSVGNKADMVRHGTRQRGAQINTAKLTEEKVKAMRRRFARGGITRAKLGQDYGVSGTMAGLIISRKSWNHV